MRKIGTILCNKNSVKYFNIYSFKKLISKYNAYKYIQTQYNVVKKTQNNVFSGTDFTSK